MSENLLVVQVKEIEYQGRDIALLELESVNGQLPKIDAGAHIDIHLGEDLVRQYSLCQDPDREENYRIGVLKEQNSRGGSEAIHALKTGDTLKISPPKNLFALDESATHSILIGGGIGITPILSMAYRLWNQKASFEVHYCAQDRISSAFVAELENENFADHFHPHFKNEGGNHRRDIPGRLKEGLSQENTHVYVCGPEPFMEWAINEAKALGYSDSQIHKEYFQADIDSSGDSFTIVAQRSGIEIEVGPEESMVDALARHNIKVDVSCEQGICGTCLCDVLEGTPDHRDLYLTDEEKEDNDIITLCCSRSKTDRLVLDI